MPGIRADLERLVRIPSVGFPGFDHSHVRASAEATAEILEAAGLQNIRTIEIPDGLPAIFGEITASEGEPTVLLYAHHDVQPEGPVDEWDSPPYEPQERGGRLYGRGTCDDKSGIVMHAAAMRAFGGRPPIGVKVLIEGEEECTSEHLDYLIGEHVDLLRADAIVIADAGMWRSGTPGLTTSIRGAVDCIVEVRTVQKALHSGEYGGPVPDAIMALARVIASLHDDEGNVAVGGLERGRAQDPPELTDDFFMGAAGIVPGVSRLGSGPLADQLWQGPSVSVVGMDVPSIQDASWQIVPVARALVTMRIAPSQDPEPALDALVAHMQAAVPWGVSANFERGSRAWGCETPPGGPFHDAHVRAMREAWGVRPVDMGMGGSVPLVPMLARAMPTAEILMTGPGDELSAAHSTNESVDLAELEHACLAEALFLRYAAERKRGS